MRSTNSRPDLAGQGAHELGFGDVPGLDQQTAERLAAASLLGQRRVELRVGEQSLVYEQGAQRCGVAHQLPPPWFAVRSGGVSTPRGMLYGDLTESEI